MTTLAEQVAEVENGDFACAEFEYAHAKTTVTGKLLFREEGGITIGDYCVIQYKDNSLHEHLTSITRVPRPIPSEPEVGSFALTDENEIWSKMRCSNPDALNTWFHLTISGTGQRISWPEIFPHIIRLYTPSGELVTGFEYAGGSK